MRNTKSYRRLPTMPSRRQVAIVAAGTAFTGLTARVLTGWFTTEYDLEGHRAAPIGVVFIDHHDLVATACVDSHLYLFSATDGTLIRRIGGHARRLTSIATYPDSDVVATGSADGQVKFWSLPLGIEDRSIVAHQASILSICFSHNGSVFASVGRDEVILVREASGGKMMAEIATPQPNKCLAVNATGSLVAAGGFGDEVVVWRARTGSELRRLSGDGTATSACFTPDGSALAVGRDTGALELWGTDTWRRRHRWQDHGAAVTDVTFSIDGRKMFTASGDRKIGVFDLESNLFQGVIKGHPKSILSVAASQGGAIASTGYGPWARIWTDPMGAIE